MRLFTCVLFAYATSTQACPDLRGMYQNCRGDITSQKTDLEISQTTTETGERYVITGSVRASLEANGTVSRWENPDGPFNGVVNEQSSECQGEEVVWISRTTDAQGNLLASYESRIRLKGSGVKFKTVGELFGSSFDKSITCQKKTAKRNP